MQFKSNITVCMHLVGRKDVIQMKIQCDRRRWELNRKCRNHSLSCPGGSAGKESTCSAGDLGLIPGLRRSPEEGHGYLLQYSFLENPHGQRSLAGYSPWGCKSWTRLSHWATTQHNPSNCSIWCVGGTEGVREASGGWVQETERGRKPPELFDCDVGIPLLSCCSLHQSCSFPNGSLFYSWYCHL